MLHLFNLIFFFFLFLVLIFLTVFDVKYLEYRSKLLGTTKINAGALYSNLDI